MRSQPRAVVIFPVDMSIIFSSAAGIPVAEYILEYLNDWTEGEVRAVTHEGSSIQPLLEKFPRLSLCSIADLGADDYLGSGLLVIDARAWFSRAAFDAITSRACDSDGSILFVESRTAVGAAQREPITLAVFLAPRDLSQHPFADRMKINGLERLLDPAANANAVVVVCSDLDRTCPPLGVVSFVDLAELERLLLMARAVAMMNQGVLMRDPATTYLRGELVCASGVEIDSNVTIEGKVKLGKDVKIGASSILRNCSVGDGATIHPFSLVENSSVGARTFVGPYGRIRPGSVIGDNVQIGNYVEIKNSSIGEGSRINHHTFIGDATLADHVTVGAGTITCNHDGLGTNKTVIEGGAYIGSGCNLIAPLHVGKDAVIGAGSTISREVPAGKLTLERGRQVTLEDWKGPKTRLRKG